MRLSNLKNVEDFLATIDECKGDVYLTSIYGDRYNLKSKLSQYVAIAAMLGQKGDELELWADDKDDERKLLNFFTLHPDVR